MNKLLFAILLCAAGVLAYARFVHDPVPPAPVEEPEPQDFLSKLQSALGEAPPAPTLPARVLAKGFHTKGQWRGNPAVADLDGDGDLDLVTSVRRWDRKTMGAGVFVYLNDGAGNFTEAVEGFERDLGYGGAAIADINADGKPDIAFSGHDQTPRIYINFLDAERPAWICATPGGVDTGVICSDVALGDFDRDGHIDLATLGQFPNQGGLLVFRGDGSGAVEKEPITVFTKDNFGAQVDFVDVDGDGFVEIVAAMDIGTRVLHWDPETRTAIDQCKDHEPLAVLGADLAIDTVDFDGDGVLEVVVSGFAYDAQGTFAAHVPLRIMRFDGTGWKDWGKGLPAGESFFDAKVGRLRPDGPPVIFAGGQWGIQAIEMSAPGEFRSLGRVDGTSGIFNLGAGDLTGDGQDDVLWIGEGGVRVYDLGVKQQEHSR